MTITAPGVPRSAERRRQSVTISPGVDPIGAGTTSWTPAYVALLAMTDIVAVLVSLVVAQQIRFGGAATLPGARPVPYIAVGTALAAVWLLLLAARGAYSHRIVGLGTEEYKRVASGTLLAAGLVAIVCYVADVELARGYVAVAFPLGGALLLVGRYSGRSWLHWRRTSGQWVHRVLVVGSRPHVVDLVQVLRREQYAGYCVLGACLPDLSQRFRDIDEIPVVSDSEHVREAVLATGADVVAVTSTPGFTGGYLRRLGWSLEGLNVDLVVAPSLTDVAGPRIHVRPVAGLPLLHVDQPEFAGSKRVGKAIVDLVGSALLLLVFAPVMAAVALAIRLDDGGPVIFRQTRIGRDGRPFTMFKFRSMVVEAEDMRGELESVNEVDGVLFKVRSDPRVTRVGKTLRRLSLDELPQLVNVLRREMSLVGPRPPLADEVATYADDARRRLLVKPGLTGLWQVSGRSDLSWYDSVRLDLYYVENWSFTQDLLILWKTLQAVLARRGAY